MVEDEFPIGSILKEVSLVEDQDFGGNELGSFVPSVLSKQKFTYF